MNNGSLSDLPAVRLASGVEPQQKWPMAENDNSSHPSAKPNHPTEGPKLIELSPTHGDEGTIVTVVVQALPAQIPAKLAFNSLMVDTKQLQAQGITSLVATVPSFQQTHSATPNVPISICFLDKDMVTETWVVADFNYTLSDDKKSYHVDVGYTDKTTSAAVPTLADTFQTKDNNDFLNSSAAAYQGFYSSPAVNSPYGFGTQVPGYPPYGGYQQQQQQQQQQPHRDVFVDKYTQQGRPQQQYSYNAPALNLFPSAGAGGFTNMLAGGLDQTTPSATTNATMSPITSAYNTAPPPTASQSRPRQSNNHSGNAVFGFKSATHTPTTSVANYQPYPGLVSRANLDIMGDLDSMVKSWTSEEWDHRRRLVQFWREQHGNKITTSFQPVPQGERASNSGNIVVSCIFWMERNDFFITSVDCIYLLECLMDIRFSVEEKNRIRRNLEGFRPLTVSKCKAESADFFKLIMSFPNPKPRNIEKDVKVFPWKTLPYALKKIVTKYTASSYNNVSSGSQKMGTPKSHASSPAPSTAPTSLLNTPTTENLPHVGSPFYSSASSTAAAAERSPLANTNYTAQSYSHELYDQSSYYNNNNNNSSSSSNSNNQQQQSANLSNETKNTANNSNETSSSSNTSTAAAGLNDLATTTTPIGSPAATASTHAVKETGSNANLDTTTTTEPN